MWVTATEASHALRVTPATLYSYVSRGFVRSQPLPGSTRERRYSRDDIERLRRRTEERRDPDKAAARALQWGLPVLESAITLIDGTNLYYRGHDAVVLSRTRSVDEVASLIWLGEPAPRDELSVVGPRLSRRLSFVARAQSMLAAAAVDDPLACDLGAAAVAGTGRRILGLLTSCPAPATPAAASIDQRLARAWRASSRAADLLRMALILCADHELNVSAFTARCIASAGSNPYDVVIGALAALQGTRHGGMSARVESMLDSMRRARRLRSAIAERLRRGEPVYGFGHPLYRDGDPRATALLASIRDAFPKSPELAYVNAFAATASSVLHEKPTIDFALAALARVLRLPPGSPLTLFAIGRTIGWIGHAMEQYANGQLIRPRATYTGVVPGAV